jgi:hypothetical protein
VIEYEQRLAVAHYLAHVLGEGPIVELDPREHDDAFVASGDLEPILILDPVVVVGDGHEVVPETAVTGHDLLDGPSAVREGRVSVQISAEKGQNPSPR